MVLQPMWRVSVQVPLAALDAVRAGILAVDPLAAGGYQAGMFEEAAGIEQYRPLPGTEAAHGRAGQLQRLPSVRLSFHLPCDAPRLARIVEQGIAPHHPWHHPVIEVVQVQLYLRD